MQSLKSTRMFFACLYEAYAPQIYRFTDLTRSPPLVTIALLKQKCVLRQCTAPGHWGHDEKEKKRKTTQAVKVLPASIKEKGIPRAEALCVPFTKRNKKEVNGDQEGY
eukprot:109079-Pelagomonas_calceolata.AAC.1